MLDLVRGVVDRNTGGIVEERHLQLSLKGHGLLAGDYQDYRKARKKGTNEGEQKTRYLLIVISTTP
jgi:hypothetical protein